MQKPQRKKKKQQKQNKNLCTVKLKITKQTKWHLQELAAMAGYGEKDLGRVVDKLMRAHCAGRGDYHE